MNMNEQDLILKQKIEKREKFDTILAYILLVILVGAIALILVLKFTRDEELNDPEEYVPNYISLNEISNSLNSSTLANRYMNDTASFNSSVSGDSLVVTYVKEDVNVNLNIPMVGNELMVTISDDNSNIVTDVYQEIANIICMYYGNEEKYCRNTLDNMNENGIDGIRFVNTEGSNTVYITTTRSYAVSNEIVYNDVIKVDINDMDYVLNLEGFRISGINIVNDNTNLVFSGNVERLTEKTSDIGIVVKLYDIDGNVLEQNKYEYNKENVLGSIGTFEIKFLFSNELKLENINTYSIEIVK